METIIFVAGIPLRGASIICFEFSIRTLCFFRCGGICDEKVLSRVGVGASKSIGCGSSWFSDPEEFVYDTVPSAPGSPM